MQKLGTTKGIIDWNHATELLKQHSGSKWHQDLSIIARMAKHVEQQNVIEMQCAGPTRQPEGWLLWHACTSKIPPIRMVVEACMH